MSTIQYVPSFLTDILAKQCMPKQCNIQFDEKSPVSIINWGKVHVCVDCALVPCWVFDDCGSNEHDCDRRGMSGGRGRQSRRAIAPGSGVIRLILTTQIN